MSWLLDPIVLIALLGNMLLAATSALVGVFAYLQKRSLATDAVSHAVLPGICLGFLAVGSKDPAALAAGAFIIGLLALFITDKLSASRLVKSDTAITLALSTFFGLGIFLLTYIQQKAGGGQSGLDKFLFGKAATILTEDLTVFTIIGLIVLVATLAFYRYLIFCSFDAPFMRLSGIKAGRFQTLTTVLMVGAVVVGLQSVGVVLMSALMVAPVSAALFYTRRHQTLCLLAAMFGTIGGGLGVVASYVFPAIPTGPAIVVVLSLLAFQAAIFSPSQGYLRKWLRRRAYERKVVEENALKAIYRFQEQRPDPDPLAVYSAADRIFLLQSERENWNLVLARLKERGLLSQQGNAFTPTAAGLAEGKRITRLHRLWEVFLAEAMNILPDHVHEDAESIEHLITPEIEAKLETYLNRPGSDPHQRAVPY